MREFIAKSGAAIVINVAPWQVAKELKKAIERCINLDNFMRMDLVGTPGIIQTVLEIDRSDLVEAALWPCLIRCTRAGEKITPETFDDTAARGDYYEIVAGCIEENLDPLFDSLRSQLKARGLVTMAGKDTQKST